MATMATTTKKNMGSGALNTSDGWRHIDDNSVSRELLESLTLFLRPIIEEYVGRSASATSSNTASHDIHAVGCRLVSALKDIITETVHSSRQLEASEDVLGATKSKEVLANVDDMTHGQKLTVSGKEDTSRIYPGSTHSATFSSDMEIVPRPILEIQSEAPTSEMHGMILVAIGGHVFNKMPIRLLAFDSSGSNIRLIERNEVCRRLYPEVLAATKAQKFQSDWINAQCLQDISGPNGRRDTMKKILQELLDNSSFYAILSHTWIRKTPGDIVYKDWNIRETNQQGYNKIVKFCEVAAKTHRLTLGWIDTVCINKDSSAELDESIRSMYKWYRGSRICITYLSESEGIKDAHKDSWFTRGWTLQELLAPVNVSFYNKSWERINATKETSIKTLIHLATSITGVELKLCRVGHVDKIPLSRRMQLASGRQVTREEDSSYSLMGILGVDIPTTYGEGSRRAFFRLFRELIGTKKNVLDLFNRNYGISDQIIASSPEYYAARVTDFDIEKGGTLLDKFQLVEPVLLTHVGLRISLLLAPGLLGDNHQDVTFTPQGDFYATYSFMFQGKQYVYKILDNRLFTDKSILGDRRYPRRILTFGIFNAGMGLTRNILIPRHCAAIGLFWDGMRWGHLTPSKDIQIRPGALASFPLNSSRDLYSIPRDELMDHGLKLVTVYL